MALETWLVKKLVRSTLSNRQEQAAKPFLLARSTAPTVKRRLMNDGKNNALGILSFETAGLMSKLLHLWRSLSDKSLVRLHRDSILSLDGVRKIVSTDESLLLGLVCAEIVESLRTAAASVARLGLRCVDPSLSEFGETLEEFADMGRDPHGWALSLKEMESLAKKVDRYVKTTASLQREIHELAALESSLRKTLQITGSAEPNSTAMDLRQKILCKREEVCCIQKRSLWGRSFDSITSMLVRLVFTVLARIKLVFRLGGSNYASPIYRSLSASAAVHPGPPHLAGDNSISGPVKPGEGGAAEDSPMLAEGFFESNSRALRPPATTLGDAALSHHYAGLIIVMEKMIRSPQLIGLDTREDLYSMLPGSVRSALWSRLRGVRMWVADAGLAAEWKDAMGRILGWLAPLAHNTIKWQSERSFEQQNSVQKMSKKSRGSSGVFLLQTLYFANRDKAEAAITELLVGLNYIWRFEREMTAKALFDSANKQHHLEQLCA